MARLTLNQAPCTGVKSGMNVSMDVGTNNRSRRSQRSWQLLALRLTGAGLLVATGAMHLDLYLTGYRTIPTIGWLFLLQVIAAFVLAAGVLLGSRLAAAAGALFALGTLGGYLLSIWVGLFNFREVRTTAGIVAGVIEVAAFAVLALLALARGSQHAQRGPMIIRLRADRHAVLAGIAGVSVIALVLLGTALAGAGTSPASSGPASTASGATLKATQIKGVTVVTNAKGFTLYWFAPDTPAKSVCNGACAAYWPPVLGAPKAGPGVTGQLGTIKRADGSTQATYDGHPLYTYIADSAPGQANGNNINLNGGFWYEVKASG
jgi:predicted lipoprotein with Yx(FWY)xxD motif